MEEFTINLKTAKLAKEKGFDWVCKKAFRKNNIVAEIFDGGCSYPILAYFYILCPTQSLLQKWLREVHDIKVYLIWYDDNRTEARWSIYINDRYINGNTDYEKALEIGLYEALKLI